MKNPIQNLRVLAASALCGALAASAFAANPLPVSLGNAQMFSALAKTGIQGGSGTDITGNIGVGPASATYLTGFNPAADASGQFSTSSLVHGRLYAATYAPPTPAFMTSAVGDMQAAYTDAAGRAPGVTELGAGDISGRTLVAGVYSWSTGLLINSDLTLTGGASDVWIFQVAQTLTLANGVHIVLAGGAQAKNIFWQVAGVSSLGTTSIFNGTILDQTGIVLNTGAFLSGKALAQTAVTVVGSSISSDCGAVPGPVQWPVTHPVPPRRPIPKPVW
jgi:hypothetical protein